MSGLDLNQPVHIQGEPGQEPAGETPAAPQPGETQDGAGKESQPAASPMDAELEVPFLGENKKAKVGEVVDLLKKSDAEVTKLREELKLAKEAKAEPAAKPEEPKADPTKVETPEEDPEVSAAVELLRSKGFITKDEAVQMVRDTMSTEKQIEAAVAQINTLEEQFKDTPLAFKADDLAAFMEENAITDPLKGFKLWKHDEIVQYEVSKGKEPTFTEGPGKEPVKGGEDNQPETSRYSVNNPDFEAVVKEELSKP